MGGYVSRGVCAGGRAAVKRPSLPNSVYSRTYVVFRQKRQRCHARTLVPVSSESHVRLLLLWAGELSRTGGHSDSQCAMNVTTNSTTSDRMMCFVQWTGKLTNVYPSQDQSCLIFSPWTHLRLAQAPGAIGKKPDWTMWQQDHQAKRPLALAISRALNPEIEKLQVYTGAIIYAIRYAIRCFTATTVLPPVAATGLY